MAAPVTGRLFFAIFREELIYYQQMSVLSYYIEVPSPLHAIALEECLVESWSGDGILFLLYVNKPSVIIGRNQNYWREVSPRCAVPVYRRTSGGGAVYHDEGNLNWAFIVPRAIHNQEEELRRITDALARLGFPAFQGSRGGLFLRLPDGEGNAKIGGTARRFGTRNILHHGTLLVHANLARMKASLGGIPIQEDTSISSVPATTVNLSSFVPNLSIDMVADHLAWHLTGKPASTVRLEELISNGSFVETTDRDRAALGRTPALLSEDLEFQVLDQRRPIQLSGERFNAIMRELGSEAWIFKKPPFFSVSLLAAGHDIELKIEDCHIVDIAANEGSLSDAVRALGDRYRGKAFSFNLYQEIRNEFEKERMSWNTMKP